MDNKDQNNQSSNWQSFQKPSGNIFTRNKELWAIIIIVLVVAGLSLFFLKDKIVKQRVLNDEEKKEILNNLNQKRPLTEERRLEIQNRLNSANKILSDEQVEEMVNLLGN